MEANKNQETKIFFYETNSEPKLPLTWRNTYTKQKFVITRIERGELKTPKKVCRGYQVFGILQK